MNDDKRMCFIRNMEALENGDVKSQVIEYEVIADANVVGEFTYGPYYFTIWEISMKQEGEQRKLCLRVRQESKTHHGSRAANELVVLTSLFLRRRFKLGPIVRIEDMPRFLPMNKKWIDKPLVASESNLSELTEWLKLVEGLDSNYHQSFILAVRLYHRALMMIEEEPDIAYLNLISAIETLCQKQNIEEVKLSDLDPQLAKLVSLVENEDLRSQIEQTILKRQRLIGRRFVAFILDHTDESFWTKTERPKFGKIKPEELADLLKRIYDQRSRTIHTGEPFPASIFFPPMLGAEIDFSLGVSNGEKRLQPKKFVPHPHFFERLVNHVLKAFLKRNQV